MGRVGEGWVSEKASEAAQLRSLPFGKMQTAREGAMVTNSATCPAKPPSWDAAEQGFVICPIAKCMPLYTLATEVLLAARSASFSWRVAPASLCFERIFSIAHAMNGMCGNATMHMVCRPARHQGSPAAFTMSSRWRNKRHDLCTLHRQHAHTSHSSDIKCSSDNKCSICGVLASHIHTGITALTLEYPHVFCCT